MVDLKELEKKLNLALEKETKESLKQWLREERMSTHAEFLKTGIPEYPASMLYECRKEEIKKSEINIKPGKKDQVFFCPLFL